MSLTPSPEMTPAKRQAQQANARRSTGPRTEAGKRRSRLNALRHGGYATPLAWSDDALRALGENPAEFHDLASRLKAAEGPSDDPLWEQQIEDLTRLCWRRRRLDRAWEILGARQAEAGEPGELVALTPEGRELVRQLEALDRAVDRKTRMLVRLRESEERRHRESLASARRRVHQQMQQLGKGFDPDSPTEEDLAVQEAELARLKGQNARLGRQAGALLQEFESALAVQNLEERSQDVVEKKTMNDEG